MTGRVVALVLLALIASPSSVLSDEAQGPTSALLRAAELPSHRFLIRLIGEENPELSAFTTDGCSGGMSAGWALIGEDFPELPGTEDGTLPWEPCCVIHDRAYHNAGGATNPDASFDARYAADEALRACVEKTGEVEKVKAAERLNLTEAQIETGYQLLAQAMFNAVRLGGGPCSGLPWRWGYGYPRCWSPLR